MTTFLFAWNSGEIGGNERRMVDVAETLVARGNRVAHFVRCHGNRSNLGELISKRDAGTIVHGGLVHLCSVTVKLGPDYVIGAGMPVSLILRMLRLSALSKSALIMPRPGLDFNKGAVYRFADRRTALLVDAFLTNSPAATGQLIRQGIAADKILEIPSALGQDWYVNVVPLDSARQVTRLGRAIMVGNARREKNQRFGIEAFLKCKALTRLDVYTSAGAAFDHLVAQAEAVGKELYVHVGVLVSPETYDTAELLLHPSLSESLPRTVLEAQSRNCLVLASEAGSTPDIISYGRTLAATSVDEWAWTIDSMLGSPSENRKEPIIEALTVSEYTSRFLAAIGNLS
ncbi:glycosyltransferase [Dietzia cercidiphylli]|uniref:Glycosyl transferase family 1 domain-containing protein n=1 Tax=Dietzia cercidiphylli TaxID=498199 RepID=A0ABN2I5R0_9ACTN|nr:glycosyltransferase [Dietzia cercidiphylli]MBB1046251.1 glycosyltransferase family 4 protein [Dietzia cercidiphylli]